MPWRKRIGNRRHSATFRKHNGNQDELGQPSPDGYTINFIVGWPCEQVTTTGGERIRGRQVSASTTHVFFGEYYGAIGVTPDMQILVDGLLYEINSVYDPNGDNMEMRVEAKRDGV